MSLFLYQFKTACIVLASQVKGMHLNDLHRRMAAARLFLNKEDQSCVTSIVGAKRMGEKMNGVTD